MKSGEYKYIVQGNTGDGWFDIMSFMASMSLQEYIDEQKMMHPTWDVRIIDNPKWIKNKRNDDFLQSEKDKRDVFLDEIIKDSML